MVTSSTGNTKIVSTDKHNKYVACVKLNGPRLAIDSKSEAYPEQLRELDSPPKTLYVLGNPECLRRAISIVGARKATPYGKACAQRFAALAARMNITVISGGAYGCDSAAHMGALKNGGVSVAVLGGGCNKIYPARNKDLFQQLIDGGGALISENDWEFNPLPYTFRLRNRIIAALSKATLIVEAGMPSGTFSTADDALSLGREVMVVPGAITAPNSKGANHLLFQGAVPIIDDNTFIQSLASLYENDTYTSSSYLKATSDAHHSTTKVKRSEIPRDSLAQAKAALFDDPLICALLTEPLTQEEIYSFALRYCEGENPSAWAALRVEEAQDAGLIMCYPDGSYGPCPQ